jgi:peptidoglycan/LPS O-acetylase OafA/YrhL
MRGGSVVSMLLLAAGAACAALGLFVFFTERGVANEIKGFVLVLLGALLAVGGCVLWELGAIRRALERRTDR